MEKHEKTLWISAPAFSFFQLFISDEMARGLSPWVRWLLIVLFAVVYCGLSAPLFIDQLKELLKQRSSIALPAGFSIKKPLFGPLAFVGGTIIVFAILFGSIGYRMHDHSAYEQVIGNQNERIGNLQQTIERHRSELVSKSVNAIFPAQYLLIRATEVYLQLQKRETEKTLDGSESNEGSIEAALENYEAQQQFLHVTLPDLIASYLGKGEQQKYLRKVEQLEEDNSTKTFEDEELNLPEEAMKYVIALALNANRSGKDEATKD